MIALPPPALVQEVPADASQPDIVVIANRLKAWRGSFKTQNGQVACRTTKSTGDKAIDAIGCDAMTVCLTPIMAELDSIAGGDRDKADRERALTAAVQTRLPCVTAYRTDAVARLAASRKRP